MKYLINILRIIVGVIFIISGFVKLDDPLGFSYKLEEYFAPDVLNLNFLVPFALIIATVMVIYELLLGVMLLVGFKKKFTAWSLLLMMIFFTFLTFYSAYFNKVTDCGCFGDAIKFTPWQSFTKDIILLILVLILFFGKKYINPLYSKKFAFAVPILVLVACVVFANYTLNHLPVIDFRPYKIGDNIQEGMKSTPPVYKYHYKFNVNGEEKIFTTDGAYPDVDGKYVSVDTELISGGEIPPVHDFSMEKDGTDYKEEFLNESKLVVLVSKDISEADVEGLSLLEGIAKKAKAKGYTVIGLTSSSREEIDQAKSKYHFDFDFYFCDLTTVKTIVRSNPAILKLDKGTILQKLSYNDANDLKL
ncbi:BT_3928 family protein [Zhouia sp. PK063]|uniref:BT_3928 family protein n=1 Tax=Zhouia sp. PK063 TaxID=3373602 RepID=UPI00379922B1